MFKNPVIARTTPYIQIINKNKCKKKIRIKNKQSANKHNTTALTISLATINHHHHRERVGCATLRGFLSLFHITLYQLIWRKYELELVTELGLVTESLLLSQTW